MFRCLSITTLWCKTSIQPRIKNIMRTKKVVTFPSIIEKKTFYRIVFPRLSSYTSFVYKNNNSVRENEREKLYKKIHSWKKYQNAYFTYAQRLYMCSTRNLLAVIRICACINGSGH